MRKLTLISFFILAITACKTTKTIVKENYKNNIKKGFIEYNNLIKNKEFEKSMNFMLPEFFEIIPKNQMVLLMKKTFNDPDIEFEMNEPKQIIIGDAKKVENKYYSKIDYTYDIKMKFNNYTKSEDEEENKLTQNLMKISLEKTFGSGNVKFNDKTGFYEIQAQKNAYGISNNGVNDWKFIVVEKKQKFILEKLLPKEITEKI